MSGDVAKAQRRYRQVLLAFALSVMLTMLSVSWLALTQAERVERLVDERTRQRNAIFCEFLAAIPRENLTPALVCLHDGLGCVPPLGSR